jgi:hypothetical protein
MAPVSKPYWVVEQVPAAPIERLTRELVLIEQRYNVMFFGVDWSQCEAMQSQITQTLITQKDQITAVLDKFKYPTPIVTGVEDPADSVPAGTYHVGVTGLGLIDDAESLISELTTVVLTDIGRFQIIIPRYPIGLNHFRKYNVYVGASPTTLLKVNAVPFPAEVKTTTLVEVDTIVGAVGAPPTDSRIKFRIINIPPEAYNASTLQVPGVESGSYFTLISLTVSAPSTPVYHRQAQPVERVVVSAEISGEGPEEIVDVP